MERPVPALLRPGAGGQKYSGQMPLPILTLLIGINLIWAGSSLAAKIALHSIPPMTLAFVRFSLAALLMYVGAYLRGVDLRVARRDWTRFWAMGILGLALTYLLSYAGIERTTASESSLIIATEPVYLAILAYLFLRERLTLAKVFGIFAGLAGVYLIIANGWHPPQFSGMVAGDLLIMIGLVFEAVSTIVGKDLLGRYPAISVMTYQMTSGAIALAPFAARELICSGRALTVPPVSALWCLFYLVVPCTVFAYTVWFTVLDKRTASEMSVYLFIQPVGGVFLGAYFLGDKITLYTVAGAFLVLIGVAFIHRRSKLSSSPPAPPAA